MASSARERTSAEAFYRPNSFRARVAGNCLSLDAEASVDPLAFEAINYRGNRPVGANPPRPLDCQLRLSAPIVAVAAHDPRENNNDEDTSHNHDGGSR